MIDYRFQQHFKGKTGMHGMGKNRHGAKGADAILRVPAGTQILDEDEETLIADMTEIGQRIRIAKGGNGGFGNAYFKTSTNQAPRRANAGLEGEERTIWPVSYTHLDVYKRQRPLCHLSVRFPKTCSLQCGRRGK